MEVVLTDCVHDEQLWFPDGSLVVQSENVLFKVYAGILSQASHVFKNMISVPQPDAEHAETYEGCPLVFLAGEKAEDMRAFLKALHDSSDDPEYSSFEVNYAKPSDVPAIASILRLSTKYDVAFLRRRAIDALQKWYPPTLPSYLPMCSTARAREEFPRHVLVANIARETDVPVLLPTALLFCCSTSNSAMLYDGVVKNGVTYDLLPANKRALFIGRPLLSHASRTKTQMFFFSPHKLETAMLPRCSNPKRCDEFCRIYSSVFDQKEDPWMNPFYQLNWKAIRSTCCVPCASSWERIHAEATEKQWALLPSFFQLAPWPVLEEQSRFSETDDA